MLLFDGASPCSKAQGYIEDGKLERLEVYGALDYVWSDTQRIAGSLNGTLTTPGNATELRLTALVHEFTPIDGITLEDIKAVIFMAFEDGEVTNLTGKFSGNLHMDASKFGLGEIFKIEIFASLDVDIIPEFKINRLVKGGAVRARPWL